LEWETYTGFSRRQAERPEWPATTWQDESHARRRHYLAEHMAEAPVLLLFIADPAKGDHRQEPRSDLDGRRRLDVHRSAEHDAGLPGRGVGLHPHHVAVCAARVKAVLGIPADWATLALLPIGYRSARGLTITVRARINWCSRRAFGVAWSG
jgi:hypothetical protein